MLTSTSSSLQIWQNFRLISAQTDERAGWSRGGGADRGRYEVFHGEGGPAQPQQLLHVSLDAAFVKEELQICLILDSSSCLRYPTLLLLCFDNSALILPLYKCLPKQACATCYNLQGFQLVGKYKPIVVSIWIHDDLHSEERCMI